MSPAMLAYFVQVRVSTLNLILLFFVTVCFQDKVHAKETPRRFEVPRNHTIIPIIPPSDIRRRQALHLLAMSLAFNYVRLTGAGRRARPAQRETTRRDLTRRRLSIPSISRCAKFH